VTVLRGEKALAVNVDAREVQTTARTLGWDALVFATGSTPFVPPIPGCDAPHVFTFRTLEDIRAIRAIAGPAVVLGGGVLGVETAAALARSGDNVTLVHRGPWLMEQQLDRQAGVLLEEALAARGVRCELASGIAAIDGNSVTLLNGRSVAARAWCWRPACSPTSRWRRPAAFAARAASWWITRCKPPRRTSTPLASAAKLTARRLAWSPPVWRRRISSPHGWPGRTAPFTLTDSGMRLKVTGVELFSLGRAAEQEGDVVWSAWDPLTRHYRRLLIHQGALAGVLLMGDCRSAATFTDLLATAAPATRTGCSIVSLRNRRLQDRTL
jgi:nitrite reductase (NADH) large subunit